MPQSTTKRTTFIKSIFPQNFQVHVSSNKRKPMCQNYCATSTFSGISILEDEDNTLRRNVFFRLLRQAASNSQKNGIYSRTALKSLTTQILRTVVPHMVRLHQVAYRNSKIIETWTPYSLVPCPFPWYVGTKGQPNAFHSSAIIPLNITTTEDEDNILPRNFGIRSHKDVPSNSRRMESSFRGMLKLLIMRLYILFSLYSGDDIWTHYLTQWHKLPHWNEDTWITRYW